MFQNRKKVLLGLAAAVLCIAATAIPATYYSVQRTQPFITSSAAFTTASPGGQVGGQVNTYIAAATLKYGDVVFISTADTVNKSTTLANYNKIAGVVVGGQALGASNLTGIATTDSGTTVATVGQQVWVMYNGRAWVTNDNNGSIAAGTVVIPSDAVSGAVETITTAIDTNYRALGRAVFGASASKFMLVNVNIK